MLGSKQCCAPGLPQHVWIQISVSSRPSTVWLNRSTRKSSTSLGAPYAAWLWIAGSSIWITLQPAAASWRSSWLRIVAMSHIRPCLSEYASVRRVRTDDARSAEIVPYLTGRVARACATRQILANSSGTRGPTLPVTAWYFQPPTISLSQVPTGYCHSAVVSVSNSDTPDTRSDGSEHHER